MSTIWVRKIDGGLDVRRLPEATEGGVLIKAEDGHLNRGGEFEKRAAFVPTYELPEGTIGLAATPTSVVVFGGDVDPGVPTGVEFQQLGSVGITRLVSWDLYEGLIYAVADNGVGTRLHYYGGAEVADWADGRAQASFNVTGGGPGATIKVVVVKLVTGPIVSITDGYVPWVTSNEATAQAIADNINNHVSSPNCTAFATGTQVTVIHPTAGTAANGLLLTFDRTGGFAVDSTALFAGGTDQPYPETGRFVKTIGTKMYTLTQSNVASSAVGDPEDWDTEAGFGFVDMSQYLSGAENLTSLADYQSNTAIFAERTVQVWNLTADWEDSTRVQVLRNTGTGCPRSVTEFGDGDVFYLDESGLRSLRARDASNSASTSGIGVRVDPLIVAKLRTLSADERARIIGLVEPQDGRFWLIMKDTIFVFSYFPEEKISGWSTYTTHYFNDAGERVDFDVDDAVVFNRRVYLRSGDTILVYGGVSTGLATDETEAEVWLPFLDGENPSETKQWEGFDAAVSGEWAVSVGMNLRDTSVEDDVCIISRTTYNEESIGAVGQSTHISPRFRSRGSGAAVLSACALHYSPVE